MKKFAINYKALIAGTAFFTSGVASAMVVDTFDQTTQITVSGLGTSVYNAYSGPGPIGGQRLAVVRDGHSGVLGGRVYSTIDTNNGGSIAYWGSTAPEGRLMYGSAITWYNLNKNPWDSVAPVNGSNLGLFASLSDTFEIDSVSNPINAGVNVFLYNGTQRLASYSFGSLAHGVNSASLSQFANINLLDLSHIDGIGLDFGMGNTFIGANVIGEIRLTQAASAVAEPEAFMLLMSGLGLISVFRNKYLIVSR